jgi:hypothetical protein
MSSPTFPAPDPDAPDPVGGNDGDPQSPQSPETPEPCDEEDSAAYLEELMAAVAAGEELTAGDISGAGFGQDGTAQQMHPGPVLATLVHAATTDEKILATLSDDDLIGVIAAVRRIGSFAAWAELTAVREFATRPDPRRPAPDPGAPVPSLVLVVCAVWMRVIPMRRSRICRAGRRCGSSRRMSWPRICTCPGTPATGPAASSDTWSPPGTPRAPRRAAGSPPLAAIWITPLPGTSGVSRVPVTSSLFVDTIIALNRPRAGGWIRRNPAF